MKKRIILSIFIVVVFGIAILLRYNLRCTTYEQPVGCCSSPSCSLMSICPAVCYPCSYETIQVCGYDVLRNRVSSGNIYLQSLRYLR